MNKDQARRIVPLLKMEIANQSRHYTNAMIARNRYQDLYNSIDDPTTEDHKDQADIYRQKIDDYAKAMAMYEIDIERLEEIQKELDDLSHSE